jgi:hypothetical protein
MAGRTGREHATSQVTGTGGCPFWRELDLPRFALSWVAVADARLQALALDSVTENKKVKLWQLKNPSLPGESFTTASGRNPWST